MRLLVSRKRDGVVAESRSPAVVASDRGRIMRSPPTTKKRNPMSFIDTLLKAGGGAAELLRNRDSSASGILAAVQGLAPDHGGLSGLLPKPSDGGLPAPGHSWIRTRATLPTPPPPVI